MGALKLSNLSQHFFMAVGSIYFLCNPFLPCLFVSIFHVEAPWFPISVPSLHFRSFVGYQYFNAVKLSKRYLCCRTPCCAPDPPTPPLSSSLRSCVIWFHPVLPAWGQNAPARLAFLPQDLNACYLWWSKSATLFHLHTSHSLSKDLLNPQAPVSICSWSKGSSYGAGPTLSTGHTVGKTKSLLSLYVYSPNTCRNHFFMRQRDASGGKVRLMPPHACRARMDPWQEQTILMILLNCDVVRSRPLWTSGPHALPPSFLAHSEKGNRNRGQWDGSSI